MRSQILFLLMLAGLTQPIYAIQQRSAQSILDQTVAALRKEEPSWTFIGGICTCIALMDEQKTVSVGSWHREGTREEGGDVRVYEISSAEAASRWLENFSGGQVAVGWAVAPYDLGVPSYISTYGNSESFSITSGKGRFLFQVSGTSRQQIDRIAKYLLRQIESDE